MPPTQPAPQVTPQYAPPVVVMPPFVPPPVPEEVRRRYPIGPALPTFSQRYWPLPAEPAGRAALAAILVAGLVGGITFVLNRPGLDWLLCGLAVAGCALVARLGAGRPEWSPPRGRADRVAAAGWALGCVALLAVTVLRANGWLAAYCLIAALGCGSLALSGGRTTRALLTGALLVLAAPFRGWRWLRYGLRGLGGQRAGGTRVGLTVALTAAVLVVFGTLLLSADAAFRAVLGNVVPGIDAGRPFAFVVVLFLAVGAAVLAARRPRLHLLRPSRTARARVPEWAVPVAALDLLFLVFVLVQLTVLFGGDGRVLGPDGPTYAEYARSGFWQLLVVTVLTLAVLGLALRAAPRDTPAQRWLLRGVLGVLCLLTLVIVASARHRMGLYEQAYGYTRLRLLVEVVELWLGLLFVLVLGALVRVRTGWLPQVVLATAVVVLVGAGIANPDRFVAQRNVQRYQETGKIDLDYLRRLSPDAVPALVCLPPDQRRLATYEVADRLGRDRDDWRTWNYGRAHARDLLAAPEAACD